MWSPLAAPKIPGQTYGKTEKCTNKAKPVYAVNVLQMVYQIDLYLQSLNFMTYAGIRVAQMHVLYLYQRISELKPDKKHL